MGLLTLDVAQQAVTTSNAPVPNARMHVYLAGTENYAALYTDFHLTTSQANPMVADAGAFFAPCYLVDGSYKVELRDPQDNVFFSQDNVEVITGGAPAPDPDPIPTNLRVFPSVADLLADTDLSYAPTSGTNQVFDDEIIRVIDQGFAYKVAGGGSFDSHVSTAGGVKLYILANDDFVSLAQWGLTPDGTTDIRPALQRAVDEFRGVYIPPTPIERLIETQVWFCSGTINVNRQVHIKGIGGTQAGWSKSVIRWPNGVPGMIFHYFDTESDPTGVVTINGNSGISPYAIGSIVDNLTMLRGDGSDVAKDNFSHGIFAKCRIGIFNSYLSGWAGNGIHIVATAAASSDPLFRGNANNWTTRDNRIQNCQNGMFIDGADANAGVSMHDDVSSCAEWGLLDSSFLGNTFLGLHTNGNGDEAKRQWNQRQYQCIDDTLGATTEPGSNTDVWWDFGQAGPGASPAWSSGQTYAVADFVQSTNGRVYKVFSAGAGASTEEPLFDGSATQTLSDGYRWLPTANEVWKSGQAVPSGGAKKVVSDSSVTSFLSCYDEAAQAVAYDQSVLALYPGHGFEQEALGVAPMLTQKGWTRLMCERAKADGVQVTYEAFGKLGAGKFTDVHLGYLSVDGLTQSGVSNFLDDGRGAVVRRDANSDASMTWMETLHGTNQTFGRSLPVAHAKYVKKLFVGSNPSNGRLVTMATSEPSSGNFARGDVIFNQSASAGGAAGWVCTTSGIAGSTAVFKAMADLAN